MGIVLYLGVLVNEQGSFLFVEVPECTVTQRGARMRQMSDEDEE